MSEYYLENRDRLLKNARDYYYTHREQYVKYQQEYYQKNKERLNARRKAVAKTKTLGRPPRPRANLDKPNKTDELEKRRKAYEAIRLSPPEPVQQTIIWNPNHTVVFD